MTRSGTPTRRAVEAAAVPATTIAITTGDNRALGRATAMMATSGRSDAVLETTGKGQTGIEASVITIPAGPTEIATIENAIARAGARSADTFTCRAGESASWFTTVIAHWAFGELSASERIFQHFVEGRQEEPRAACPDPMIVFNIEVRCDST